MPAIAISAEAAAATPNELDLGVPRSSRSLYLDPQVLERTWIPPALIGRDEVLSEVETRVLDDLTQKGRVAVSIYGPRGSGTSTVAAHLVATSKDHLTRPGAKGAPLVLQVGASAYRSPSALVTALFRVIDPSYDGRGASAEFSLLLFLRRLRTIGRPVILFSDQIGAKMDLSRVLLPLARPDRLMPEGPAGLPTMLVVAAGGRDAFPEDSDSSGGLGRVLPTNGRCPPFLGVDVIRSRLAPLDHHDLCQAIQVRANLAFQQPPSRDVVEAIARLSVAQGWGLSMVGELLTEAGRRAEARGAHRVEATDVALPELVPRHGADAEGLGVAILDVLREAPGPLAVGELRGLVQTRCAKLGIRAPTQARLWRHLVGLERKGVVRREVRIGGTGGSATLVNLTGAVSVGGSR